MPDHIHAIIFLYPDEYAPRKDGSSRAPTPTNEMLPHIVRDREDYETRAKYIYENPIRWYYDELYTDE